MVTLLDNNYKNHITDIENITILGNGDKLVKLKDIADITIGQGHYNIYHDAGRRVQIITANVLNGATEKGIDEIKRIINEDQHYNNIYINIAITAVKFMRKQLIFISCIVLIGILLLVLMAINNIKYIFNTCKSFICFNRWNIAAFITGGLLSIGSIVSFVIVWNNFRNSIMLVTHYQTLVFKEGFNKDQETAIKSYRDRLLQF